MTKRSKKIIKLPVKAKLKKTQSAATKAKIAKLKAKYLGLLGKIAALER